MELIREVLRGIHIGLGFFGLAVFWLPIVLKKGSRGHILFGKLFAICAYLVTTSAIVSAIILMTRLGFSGRGPATSPAEFGFLVFLLYLAIVALAGVHHGLRAVKAKRERGLLDTPLHRLSIAVQMVGSGIVFIYALVFWSPLSVVFLALSPLGVLGALGMRRYVKMAPQLRMHWWYEHMSAMIGTGIAFYTAFAVFGSGRFFHYELAGPYVLLPWVIPAAIGIPATSIWVRYYQRKFRDVSPSGGRGISAQPTHSS